MGGGAAQDEASGGLFGRIALRKGLITEDQLVRALRLQEEIRRVGLARPLGQIFVDDGLLAEGQVERILRLQAINVRARVDRAFGRVAVKNGLITQAQLDEALRAAREEGHERPLEVVLVAQGALELRAARAINSALERARGGRRPDATPPPGVDPPTNGRTATSRLANALDVDEEDAAATAADPEQTRRRDDVVFAAVALRDGLVLVPELERAVEEQHLRPERPTLEKVLVDRGVLTARESKAVRREVESARQARLAIPGYEVQDILGYGATSLVLRARHSLIGREAAIKLFRPEHMEALAAENPAGGVEALVEEARQIARVRHPNVVELYEVGRVHRRLFFVMELVSGRTLHERIRNEGALPVRDALLMARDVARALAAIHEAGLVHRDVKPQNILFTRRDPPGGSAKLTDLGLAVEPGRQLGTAGAIFGSPHTMSPEQADGQPVDARADLYGLGCTLYIALTEVPPFDGNDAMTILMGHLTSPIPDPRALRPDLPALPATLVMKLLGKTPSDRPASAAKVAAALDQIIGD